MTESRDDRKGGSEDQRWTKRLVTALLVVPMAVAASCGSTPVAAPIHLAISAPTVVKEIENPLEPKSCVANGITVVAEGSFNDVLLASPLDQYGKYVNLYVYANGLNLLNPGAGQIADLSTEHPLPIQRPPNGTWRVTATLKTKTGQGATCVVEVQSNAGSPLISTGPA